MLRITTEKKRGKIFLSVEGPTGGAVGGGAGAVLAGVARGVAKREVPRESLRRELHRCCRKSAADGNSPAGRPVNRRRLPEPAIVQEIVAREKQGTSNSAKERPKRSHIIFYTVFFSLMLGPTMTRAQGTSKLSALPGNAPTQVLRLTLDQAVGLALKQNTTAQIAILQAAQSEQDKNIARADLLPHAKAQISDEAQKVNLLAQFGGRTPFPDFPRRLDHIKYFPQGRASAVRSLT